MVDWINDKVYKYSINGAYQNSGDFNLSSDNGYSGGITYYDNAFWVVDGSDAKVYRYTPLRREVVVSTLLLVASWQVLGEEGRGDIKMFYRSMDR